MARPQALNNPMAQLVCAIHRFAPLERNSASLSEKCLIDVLNEKHEGLKDFFKGKNLGRTSVNSAVDGALRSRRVFVRLGFHEQVTRDEDLEKAILAAFRSFDVPPSKRLHSVVVLDTEPAPHLKRAVGHYLQNENDGGDEDVQVDSQSRLGRLFGILVADGDIGRDMFSPTATIGVTGGRTLSAFATALYERSRTDWLSGGSYISEEDSPIGAAVVPLSAALRVDGGLPQRDADAVCYEFVRPSNASIGYHRYDGTVFDRRLDSDSNDVSEDGGWRESHPSIRPKNIDEFIHQVRPATSLLSLGVLDETSRTARTAKGIERSMREPGHRRDDRKKNAVVRSRYDDDAAREYDETVTEVNRVVDEAIAQLGSDVDPSSPITAEQYRPLVEICGLTYLVPPPDTFGKLADKIDTLLDGYAVKVDELNKALDVPRPSTLRDLQSVVFFASSPLKAWPLAHLLNSGQIHPSHLVIDQHVAKILSCCKGATAMT